jgi:Putative endonuclease segE, GIY-YIG domain
MKIKSLLKFLTTSLDSYIESPTFKQDASTLERNYSHLLGEYYGSNKELLHDIATLGGEHFQREILHLCANKGRCNYLEAKLQFQYGVLEHPDKFYNDWIMCKVHRKHLK